MGASPRYSSGYLPKEIKEGTFLAFGGPIEALSLRIALANMPLRGALRPLTVPMRKTEAENRRSPLMMRLGFLISKFV